MLRRFLFWTCLPFVLSQAVAVRRNAPRFAAAAGPTEGSAGSGNDLRLVAIGDSIVAGVGAEALEKALVGQTARALSGRIGRRVKWSAMGIIGADAGTVLKVLLPKMPRAAADAILVSVGVNDVTSLARVSRWQTNLSDLLTALQQHSPEGVIVLAGVPPLGVFPLLPEPLRTLFGMRAKTFDKAARRVVSRFPSAVYLPVDFDPRPEMFADDGYHPSEAGYAKFGAAAAESIARRLRDGSRSPGTLT